MRVKLRLLFAVMIVLMLTAGFLLPAAATEDASLSTLLQNLYQLAGRYMREGKYEEAADLYYQLINYDYLDSYELFREANDTQDEETGITAVTVTETPTPTPAPTADPNQTVSLTDAFSSSSSTQAATVYTKPEVVPWPRVTITSYTLNVKDRGTTRIMGYGGPGKAYMDAGGYYTSQFSRIDGLFREGDFVFVDFNYKSVGVRRLYIEARHFENADIVPELTITGYPGITVTSVVTYYGPGISYNPINNGELSSGTVLTVFLEERNYVFAEFDTDNGTARGWIDARYVEPI